MTRNRRGRRPPASQAAKNRPPTSTLGQHANIGPPSSPTVNRRPPMNQKPTSGPISLATLVAAQPARPKNNKSWRPMQPSDFADDGNGEATNSAIDDFSAHESNSGKVELEPSRPAPSRMRATRLDLQALQTTLSDTSSFVMEDGSDMTPANAPVGVDGDHAQLPGIQFSHPTRLDEEGKFDGQVLFISQSNRNVSAQQWSLRASQWVNIGLFSYRNTRIEGSLASDRLRGVDIPHNTLAYFKAVAEQRETSVREEARQDEQNTRDLPLGPRVEALRRSVFDDLELDVSRSSASESTGGQASSLPGIPLSCAAADVGSHPTPTFGAIIGLNEEDPFVDPIPPLGSMDMKFKFPRVEPKDAIKRGFAVPCRDRTKNGHGDLSPVERFNPIISRRSTRPSPEEDLSELDDPIRYPRLPFEVHAAIPYVERTLSESPGPTIANPHRVVSTLNALAAPYQPSNTPALGVTPAAFLPKTSLDQTPLRYNAIEAAHARRMNAIVFGVGRAPTAQSFTGPFFAGPMPTVHGPGGPHPLQHGHNEGLRTWFHGGQRPARQQAFAGVLVGTGELNMRNQSVNNSVGNNPSQIAGNGPSQTVGNVPSQPAGNGSPRTRDLQFKMTSAFIMVHDNMYESVEESRAEGRRLNFWTRAWTSSRRLSRGSVGADDNDRFFGEGYNNMPEARAIPHMSYHPYGGPAWARGLPHPNTVPLRYTNGGTADSQFGGRANNGFGNGCGGRSGSGFSNGFGNGSSGGFGGPSTSRY